MRAATRLALYGVGVVVAFGASFGLAGLLVPDSVVENWNKTSQVDEHDSQSDKH